MRISNPVARFGEEKACGYLIKKGYNIIDRNFRKGYGEIDIIATKDNILIFVEVKTRTTSLFGGAKEAISYLKLKKLTRTAQFYKFSHHNLPYQRFLSIFICSLRIVAVSKSRSFAASLISLVRFLINLSLSSGKITSLLLKVIS